MEDEIAALRAELHQLATFTGAALARLTGQDEDQRRNLDDLVAEYEGGASSKQSARIMIVVRSAVDVALARMRRDYPDPDDTGP